MTGLDRVVTEELMHEIVVRRFAVGQLELPKGSPLEADRVDHIRRLKNPALGEAPPDAEKLDKFCVKFAAAHPEEILRIRRDLTGLAFSGGGTRAAAFSYGVLEFLRRTEVLAPNGTKVRLLEHKQAAGGQSWLMCWT